jgi:hypothetical protein
MRKITGLVLSLPVAFALALPPDIADARNRKDRVAIGIGVGLLGGALASRGDAGAMIGGAIGGGVIGSAYSRHRDRERYREWRRESRDHRDRHRR